jgi:hypothetical protein
MLFYMAFIYLLSLPGSLPLYDQSQSDWSGGSGFPGPVAVWGDAFFSSIGIDWVATGGQVSLVSVSAVPEVMTADLASPACMDAADLDGDGDIDVVCSGFAADKLIWLENRGGLGWLSHDVDENLPGCCATKVWDMDNDGHPDIINAAETSGAVSWYRNNGSGGGWQKHVISSGGGSPFSLQVRDYDEDGDPDVCAALYGSGRVVLWENADGAATIWTLRTVKSGWAGAWWVESADLDLDGDWDIIASRYSGELCWFENTGMTGAWEQHAIASGLSGLVNFAPGDLDSDGDLDMASASMTPGRICLHENLGLGLAWVSRDIDIDLVGPWSCCTADLDGDGDTDLIANDRTAGFVQWYMNAAGDGTDWVRCLLGDGYALPNDVISADLDGDGLDDPVGSIANDNSVIWWKLADCQAQHGSLTSSILDAGEDAAWGVITWECDLPGASDLVMAVRAGQNPDNLGSWQTVANSGDDLSTIISDPVRYMQYRVTLLSDDPDELPVFSMVTFNADLMGVEAGEAQGLPRLQAPSPCVHGAVPVHVITDQDSRVSVLVHDLSGRVVNDLFSGFLAAGNHCLTWDSTALPQGVYTIVLTAPQECSTVSVVLLW